MLFKTNVFIYIYIIYIGVKINLFNLFYFPVSNTSQYQPVWPISHSSFQHQSIPTCLTRFSFQFPTPVNTNLFDPFLIPVSNTSQ